MTGFSNQMTGFYMQFNTGMKWVKKIEINDTNTKLEITVHIHRC